MAWPRTLALRPGAMRAVVPRADPWVWLLTSHTPAILLPWRGLAAAPPLLGALCSSLTQHARGAAWCSDGAAQRVAGAARRVAGAARRVAGAASEQRARLRRGAARRGPRLAPRLRRTQHPPPGRARRRGGAGAPRRPASCAADAPQRTLSAQRSLARRRAPQSCDLCGGVGKVKCFDCNVPDGFTERVRPRGRAPQSHQRRGNRAQRAARAAQEGKRKGFKDILRWGWFGEVVEERPCTRCNATGGLVCPRCKGKRKLLFRSAAWR
jgi:hypothetical protein